MDEHECNICSGPQNRVPATVDGKTVWGPWGFLCDHCHMRYGVGLGVGLGQRLPGAPLAVVTP